MQKLEDSISHLTFEFPFNQGCAPKSGRETGHAWMREIQPDANPERIIDIQDRIPGTRCVRQGPAR